MEQLENFIQNNEHVIGKTAIIMSVCMYAIPILLVVIFIITVWISINTAYKRQETRRKVQEKINQNWKQGDE